MMNGFAFLVEKVHSAMGCNDVLRKPCLQYKMSGITGPIELASDNDWENLCLNVRRVMKKDKIVPVQIIIDKDVSDTPSYRCNYTNLDLFDSILMHCDSSISRRIKEMM